MIHFPMPTVEERYKIWSNSLPAAVDLEPKVELREIAEKYEISGGAIINIIQHCSLRSLGRGNNIITLNDMLDGIKREYHKNRRTL